MKNNKPWKIAVNSMHYGERGHKLFAILSYIDNCGPVSYEQLNRFSYNYTRRGKDNALFTGEKFDKVKNRGYIGSNLYGGYLSTYVSNYGIRGGAYRLTPLGVTTFYNLFEKFGWALSYDMSKLKNKK